LEHKTIAKKPAPAVKRKPAKRKPREDVNQATARIVKEATEQD
jgi:hypothetical protein